MPDGIYSRSRQQLTLRLTPLTPVHIGDGTTLGMDEYLIEDDALCRFDPLLAARSMSPDAAKRFKSSLDRADLGKAAEQLREAGKKVTHSRTPISEQSHNELNKAMTRPMDRIGEIHPFVRSDDRPYVPGSSIKGAFRTALASAALGGKNGADIGGKHENALRTAFDLDTRDTSTDPLRFLSVSDAFLPKDATVIDRAEVFNPRKPDATKMQMHYERTRCLLEEKTPSFELTLTCEARPDLGSKLAMMGNPLSVIQKLRDFHYNLFRKELEDFFPREKSKIFFRAILDHISPGGQPPVVDKSYNPNFVLLRLGRFSHFECKSLEGIRQGSFPQAKRRGDPNEWGKTRTTVAIDGQRIPFGWVVGWVKEQREI